LISFEPLLLFLRQGLQIKRPKFKSSPATVTIMSLGIASVHFALNFLVWEPLILHIKVFVTFLSFCFSVIIPMAPIGKIVEEGKGDKTQIRILSPLTVLISS